MNQIESVMDSNDFFTVNILYPKFAVLAGSKQLTPVTVKFRLDFVVCDLQGHLLCHIARVGPMFPCSKRLETGLPAFQLPMFAKCEALPKGDLFDMFVEGIHSRYSLLQRHSTHEEIRESVRVNY